MFQIFTSISKYNEKKQWNEGFARTMAHSVSKLMNIDYITTSKFNAHLFCMLNCISFAAIGVTISDVDMTRISSDILRFIYTNPDSGWSGREVTIINLSNPQKRKVSR
jgi:hypothetical protein